MKLLSRKETTEVLSQMIHDIKDGKLNLSTKIENDDNAFNYDAINYYLLGKSLYISIASYAQLMRAVTIGELSDFDDRLEIARLDTPMEALKFTILDRAKGLSHFDFLSLLDLSGLSYSNGKMKALEGSRFFIFNDSVQELLKAHKESKESYYGII